MNLKATVGLTLTLISATLGAQPQTNVPYQARFPVTAPVTAQAGKLEVSPVKVEFTNVAIGSHAEQTISLANRGGMPLAFSALEHSGPFTLTHDCPASLAAGAVCAATIGFAPNNAMPAEGYFTVQAGTASASIPLTGAGKGVAFDLSTPGPVNFGAVSTGGTSSPKGVSVLNIGSESLTLSAVQVPAGFTAEHNCSNKVPGAQCSINVVFQPTIAKEYSGNLVVSAVGSSVAESVTLTGTGVVPVFEIKANNTVVSKYDFGEVGVNGTSGQVTFSIKNIAKAPVSFGPKNVFVPEPFSEVGSTCTGTLAVGATCTVNVQFSPRAVETYSGLLEIDSDNSSYTPIVLSGKGILQELSTWALVDYPAALPTAIWDIQYANGMYVAVGDGSRLSVGATLANLHQVYYTTGATGTYMAVEPYRDSWVVAESGYARVLMWKGLTAASTNLSPTSGTGNGSGGFLSLETDGSRLVAGTSTPTYHTSRATSDGVTWQASGSSVPSLSNNNSYIKAIKRVNSTWVAAGYSSSISVSTDGGLTWALRGIGIAAVTYEAISDVTYGNGTWVMVSDKGRIFTSANATNWTLRTPPSGVTSLTSVEFGPSGFVAVGAAGTILKSTDGLTWTKMVSPFGSGVSLRKVRYLNGQWLIIGSTRQFAIGNP